MKFLEIEWKNKIYRLWLQKDKKSLWVHYNNETWSWSPKAKTPHKQKGKSKSLKDMIVSAMPGRIDKISVKKGDKVKKDQDLLVMSAMKIEYNFKAEAKGTIEDVYCQEGETVDSGQNLIKVKYESS